MKTSNVVKILEHLNLKDESYQRISLSRDNFLSFYRQDLLDDNQRQNDGPSIREFVEFLAKNPTIDANLSGYIIGTSRHDCRLSIDCIFGEFEFKDEMSKIIDSFRMADEFEIKGSNFRAWWD